MLISATASRVFERLAVGASRASTSPALPATRGSASAAANDPTRVTLGGSRTASPVYGPPRSVALSSIWSSPSAKDDPISALMARNRGFHSYTVSDQWRGLGGALLRRLADTGENFSQTMVDDVLTPDDLSGQSTQDPAQRAEEIQTERIAALNGVATHAPNATLKIQTRSGQSVELKIAVSGGINGFVGMQVDIASSGTLNAAERGAVAQLADGLDRALQGLGLQESAVLDLSGLVTMDRRTLSGLELSFNNPTLAGSAVQDFSMRLSDDQLAVSMKGVDGEMALSVDPSARGAIAPGTGQAQALQRALDRMDRAADRSHANAALLAQMKSAFSDLQRVASEKAQDDADGANDLSADASDAVRTSSTSASGTTPLNVPVTATRATPGVNGIGGIDDDARSALSGLADFEASFGGQTMRPNQRGTMNEAGSMAYALSQKTQTSATRNGRESTTQTMSEQLSAQFRKAPGDAMLDVRQGNYSDTRIQDRRTITTLIDASGSGPAKVLRRSESQEMKSFTEFQNHRQVQQRVWPNQQTVVERLR